MNPGQDILHRRVLVDSDVPGDQPLDRAFAVLNAVVYSARPASITEVAGDCGLPVPTVHRLVAHLEKRGMVARALGSKRLVVGSALIKLGIASVEAALRADRPHQVLVALANRLGEHCQIGRRVDNHIVYVDSAKAPRSEGLYLEQGRRSPLHCSSIGKLFLAEMSDSDMDWWLSRTPLDRLTPATMAEPDALRATVKRVRKEGWVTSNQELMVGVVGCAVPIRDSRGRLLAGLGISAPSARVSFDQLHEFRSLMESSAADVAAALLSED